jgi:hypothetical protein
VLCAYAAAAGLVQLLNITGKREDWPKILQTLPSNMRRICRPSFFKKISFGYEIFFCTSILDTQKLNFSLDHQFYFTFLFSHFR